MPVFQLEYRELFFRRHRERLRTERDALTEESVLGLLRFRERRLSLESLAAALIDMNDALVGGLACAFAANCDHIARSGDRFGRSVLLGVGQCLLELEIGFVGVEHEQRSA